MSATLPLGASDLRDAIVAGLAAALPGVVVSPHGGTFDEAEIRRVGSGQTPAVYVAVLGSLKASRFADGRVSLPLHVACVVVTRDAISLPAPAAPGAAAVQPASPPAVGSRLPRDVAGLQLSSAVALALFGPTNRWGVEGAAPPEDVTIRNEFSGAIDRGGIALFQVTWTQAFPLGATGAAANGQIVAALATETVNLKPYWSAAGGLVPGADPLDPAGIP